MLANHKLAKVVADMGFSEFRRQLEYKCQLYRSELVVVDRWFPSSKTCSNCGTKKETLSLCERVFHCDHCDFECDRDLNASINLDACRQLDGVSLWTGKCRHPGMKQEVSSKSTPNSASYLSEKSLVMRRFA